MIRINQLKLPVGHEPEAIRKKAAKLLRVSPDTVKELIIRRRSLDARKKPELFYNYVVDVTAVNEKKILSKCKDSQISLHQEPEYRFPKSGSLPLRHRPVIIGSGPAGLFCGLMLAQHGYHPLILERGEDVETRQKRVDEFWQNGHLDVRSNVQFGEGGAGTFSDGKLNTLVKDPAKRGFHVLEIFHQFGADASILYDNKPHIGTDVLAGIVKGIREEIIRLGGEVRFSCRAADLEFVSEKGNRTICAVVTEQGERIETETVVLAIGHSARDTFEMLLEKKIPMSQKAFAVGLRIQHPQSMINLSQYGREEVPELGAASYKLTQKTSGGRGVYSFCMCPGGYVVNASSEEGRLAVNGMSYHDRAGINANSALIVTVEPSDFAEDTPLAGIAFQRELEEKAFAAGGGKIPVQLYRDFRENRIGTELGAVVPQTCGAWSFANLRDVLPEYLSEALLEAMKDFGHRIQGFDREDALFAGVESRTSSPVRIWRNETMESEIAGLYPCGEGAGYAGGITSAAMDGVRVAEAIAEKYEPFPI